MDFLIVKCEICKKSFSRKDNLYRHQRIVHNIGKYSNLTTTNICLHCSIQYFNIKNLNKKENKSVVMLIQNKFK